MTVIQASVVAVYGVKREEAPWPNDFGGKIISVTKTQDHEFFRLPCEQM